MSKKKKKLMSRADSDIKTLHVTMANSDMKA